MSTTESEKGDQLRSHAKAPDSPEYWNLLFSAQIEASIDGIIMVDDQGDIINYNQHFKELWEVPGEILESGKSDAVLTYVMDKLGEPAEFLSRVNFLYEHKELKSKEEVLLKDGRILDRFSSPIMSADGIYYGRIWYYRDITKQKRAELNLTESEAKFRSMAEKMNDFIATTDLNGIITYASPAAQKMFGCSPEAMIGTHFMNHLEPKDIPIAVEAFRLDMESASGTTQLELHLKRSDGTTFIGELNGVRFFIDKRPHALVTIHDITERMAAQQALINNEERLNQITESSGVWVWEVDTKGLYTYVSPMLVNILGYSPEEFIGKKHFYDFFPPDVSEDLKKGAFEIFARKEHFRNFENPNLHRNGRIVILETSGVPILDIHGNLLGYRGADKDITERKQAENAIRESEEKYRSLVETAQELVWKCDDQFRFIYLNPAWEGTHGYKLEEMLGRQFSDFQQPEVFDRDKLEFARHLAGGFVKEYETTHIAKDGSEITLLFNAVPRTDINGKIIGTQGTAVDITHRKLMEQELYLAKEKAEESDRLKTAFLTNMSHEIRTPMNSIMGFANLLTESEVQERENYISIILNSSNQLLNIIDDVVYASRLQSEKYPIKFSKFKPADLVTYVYHIFDLPEPARKVVFKLNIPEKYKNLTIISDADKIRHILTILASNALKYTFEGSVEMGFDLTHGSIEFFVHDTGIGIPINEQEHIFKSFYRGQKAISKVIGGTGLGLNIAKMLVDLLNGKIGFSSIIDKGSQFYFSLPEVKFEDSLVRKPAGGINQKEVKDCRVLIAEDESDSFLYLNILLRNKVKSVDRAKNGMEAVEMAGKKNYDFILMDLKMPLMGGIEAIQKLKIRYPLIPIIAQTAYATHEEKEKAMEAGCNDYLTKPIRKDELFAMIEKYYVNP